MRIHQRILLLLLLNILFCGWAAARQSHPDLMEINRDRVALNSTGMLVLGGLAVSNIAAGSIGMFRSDGSVRYFHQMNAAWNTVNLAIAGFGYYGLKNSSLELSLSETITDFHNIEKILLFNSGLDIGYMALGAFLLSFDIILWLLNRNQSSILMEIINRIQFTGTGMALQIPF